MGARDAYLRGNGALIAPNQPPIVIGDDGSTERDVGDGAITFALPAASFTFVPPSDDVPPPPLLAPGEAALRPFFADEDDVPVPVEPAPAPETPTGRALKSEIPGVPDEAWTKFTKALKTASPSAVSASNAFGMFELKPRRLEDLGLVTNTSCTRSPTGRMVWVGEFVAPMTLKSFLGSPKLQYRAFAASMKNYVDRLRNGSIPRPDGGKPDGMTLSGALAILHRCGPSGLKTWNDESKRFEDTKSLYSNANGVF